MAKQNVRRFNEPVLAPSFLQMDGSAIGGSNAPGTPSVPESATDITVSEDSAPVQRVTFTLDIVDGVWSNTGDVANINLGSFGRDVMVLGSTAAMILTKKGALLASTDFDLGVGTIENTSLTSTLAGNEDILVEKLDFNDDSLNVLVSWISGTGTTRTATKVVESSDSIWINMYGNVSTDATYNLRGTITFFVVDMGSTT